MGGRDGGDDDVVAGRLAMAGEAFTDQLSWLATTFRVTGVNFSVRRPTKTKTETGQSCVGGTVSLRLLMEEATQLFHDNDLTKRRGGGSSLLRIAGIGRRKEHPSWKHRIERQVD